MNARYLLTSILMLQLLFVGHTKAAYEDEVLADNPVAYWQMDEVSVDDPPVDVTGQVETFSVGWDDRGGMSFGNPGIPGTEGGTSIGFQDEAFSFACNNACGGGAIFHDFDFDFDLLDLGTIGSGEPITMEAWFTLESGWESSSYPRLFHFNYGIQGQYTFGIVGNGVPAAFPEARTVFAGRGDGASGSVIKAAETGVLPSDIDTDPDEFFHLVAQSQSNSISLWLNGVELPNLVDSDPIGWADEQATIGARAQGGGYVQSFPGHVDEVALYDTLLSPARIQAHYEAGIAGGGDPVCGDFDMDGDVDVADRTIQTVNWTGAGNVPDPPKTFAEGDCDGDGDVDVADQTGTIQNWTGAMAGNAEDGDDADLIYDPVTGNVSLDASDTASGEFISFVVATDQNNMRPENAQFPFINTGTNTDAQVFQIGQTDALNLGAGPTINLGDIFPPGIASQQELIDYLSLAEYASDLGAGGTLDIRWIPEPSGLLLFMVGVLGLGMRRRRQPSEF